MRNAITADESLAGEGLWISTPPPGLSDTVQVLALGAAPDPGVLKPGDSGRIPIYYRGLKLPWDFSYPPIMFTIGVLTADDPAPIDWSRFETDVRPAGEDPAVWEPVFARLKAQIGSTWGEYVVVLTNNARARAQYTTPSCDVTTLLDDEIQEAYAQGNGGIVGRVSLANGGGPVTGVRVTCLQDDGDFMASAMTNEAGDFLIRFVAPATYSMEVEGHVLEAPVTVQVLGDETTTGVALAVRPGGVITGNTTAEDGSPLGGAAVTAVGSDNRRYTAVAEQSGAYRIQGLPSGVYNVRCELDGYVLAEHNDVSVSLGVETPGIDFHLELGWTLTGRVTPADGGESLSAVTVTAEQGETVLAATETRADGSYTLLSLTPGMLTIRFQAQGFRETAAEVAGVAGGTANLDASLEKLNMLKGSVVDSGTGGPIKGVRVQAVSDTGGVYSAVSSENGSYEIVELPAGQYIVALGGIKTAAVAPTRTEVGPLTPVVTVGFTLSVVGRISGLVLDADGATPPPGLFVRLLRGEEVVASAVSEYDGGYAFVVLQPGMYEVRAADVTHCFPSQGGLSITQGTQLDHVNLVSGTGVVAGVVRARSDGTPVFPATVSIHRVLSADSTQPVAATETDVSGAFTFQGVRAGAYRVFVSAPGWAWAQTETTTLANGGRVDLLLELSTAASVSGGVRDADGLPISGAVVMARNQADGVLQTATLSDQVGQYTLGSLAAGEVELTALHHHFSFATALIPLSEGSNAVQDLMPWLGSGSVTGAVRDDVGLNLPDAFVTAADQSGRVVAVTTSDELGGCNMSGLVSGLYSIKATMANHVCDSSASVDLSSGGSQSDVDIVLNRAAIALSQANQQALRQLASAGFGEAVPTTPRQVSPIPSGLASGNPCCESCRDAWQNMNLAEQAGLGACAAYDGATKAYWGKALYSIGIIEAGIAMTGLASELAGALAGALELSESTASGILARGLLEASLSDMKEAALSTLDGRPWDGKASETAAIDKLASAGITATATTVLQYGLHSSEETLAQVTGWWSNLSRAISMAKEIARADWRELLRLAAEMNSAEAAMHAAWKRFIASRKVYQSRCAKCRRRDKDPDAPTNGNGAGSSKSVGAFDPNAKIGPAGFGAGGFVDLDQPLAYAIYFENEEGATAAARRASIADELDANLDWTTFEVGEVAFGSHLVAVPGGSKHYETSLPIDGWTWNETQGWHTGETPPIVDIVCDLDAGSGQATWPITCIDPNTGLPPETPYAGFVPPNGAANQDPRGEGHADYLVRAKAGLATGTQITNQASIVFDYNPPVATPTTLHTIDPGTPTSNVTALPTTTSTYPFAISWTGQDEAGGSGIATFDIYVSVDNGPFALWLSTTDTSGSFNGQPGHSYAFYSIAADNVGHVEAPPATVDATITIPISKPVAPTLGAVTATTVALADLGGGNVGSVPHAVFEEITSKYVGADGMLTAQPLWRSMDDWAGTVVWGGLTPQTEYHFRSKAQLFDTTETELGDTLIAITSLQGDANGDGEITGADKQAVQAAMGSSPGQQNWDPRADLNGDHNVTEADLRLVQLTRFDSDRDGDVDQSDFSHFQVCWTGPIQGNMRGGCGDVDFNDDGQVDQADLDLFEQCASGPGTAINPGCMD